jgi:hypothetical protein
MLFCPTRTLLRLDGRVGFAGVLRRSAPDPGTRRRTGDLNATAKHGAAQQGARFMFASMATCSPARKHADCWSANRLSNIPAHENAQAPPCRGKTVKHPKSS